MTNPTQDLYQLLYQLRKKEQGEESDYLLTHKTPEGRDWWQDLFDGQRPDIPAASIEDLRKAGMMPEPEKVIKDFERVDKPSFFCRAAEEIGVVKCKDQCAYCKDAEDTGSSIDTAPPPFFCHRDENMGVSRCQSQCEPCAEKQAAKPQPSITLSDYARMEREEEAITNPAHYKVCEGLEVMDIIRAVLTPEQLRGHYIATIIAYRMRAGKKTMSPMEDLGKAHVYETWLAEMEGGED
jgi:hypothetical protein